MVITPNSDVILLKCPLELDQENQLNFANATAQYNYFNGLSKYVAGTDFTYQRKDNIIRISAKYDDLISYNYVMYRNDNYSNKWFYAFIEKMEYINDSMTSVKIKTDTFQTWQFDLTYKRTFVEREHVNDDTIGLHTVPEGLDVGEYKIVDLRDIPLYDDAEIGGDKWTVCFAVTALPEGCAGAVDGRVAGDNGLIGGVFNSLKFFAVYTLAGAKEVIHAYDNGSVTSDAIVNVYMIPRCCYNKINNPTTLNGHALYPLNNYYNTDDLQLQEPVTLAENYTPVNRKLYCYPYSYIYMSNNVGEDITLNWEDFPIETISGITMPTMTYYKYLVPSASLSAKLILTKYKTYASDSTTATQMVNYGIGFGKLPVCAWTTDYYTNWLTQNGVNVGVSMASAGASMALGVAGAVVTGGASLGLLGLAGGMLGGASSIGNTLAEMHKAQTVPPEAHGNINTGDMVYALKRNSISCYFMSIKKEVAQIIDSYFSMYGYKVNVVKVPNVTGRANWNFVKTINCYIQADIPQEDLQEIKDMFNRGLTIWHNPATFMDYSQPNAIV
jgi:hypothetical protein